MRIPSPSIFVLLGALLLGGCETFKEEELAVIRGHKVSPATYGKMKERHPVTPDEIVELTARRVPDQLIVKQIDRVGIDYALRKSEVAQLERAGVSRAVMEALYAASTRFVTRYAPPEYFESHNLDSGEYVDAPPLYYYNSLNYNAAVAH